MRPAAGKLTSKGQVTIPRAIREALGVRTGDHVLFELRKDGVRMSAVPDENPFLPLVGFFRVGKGLTRKQVDDWIDDIRGHDTYDRKLLGR
ncbi:MAG: AbrB/MazE/SpoVT family DNA-binding domain-containing protein [Vulcanimicrobiaceae bacterium]